MIRQFRTQSVAVVASLALIAAMLAPATVSAQNLRPVDLPVVGTVVGGGTFTGTITQLRFVNQNGQLMATVVGNWRGTVKNAQGVETPIILTIAKRGDVYVGTTT